MSTIRYAGLTDVGCIRTENEDQWYADLQNGIFLVADGMGGQAAGALASKVVADVLPQLLLPRLQSINRLDVPAVKHQIMVSLSEISEKLHRESRNQPSLRGMGSTVVLLLLCGQQALIAHLGDSRAYLLHLNDLQQLTKDHTMIQLLLDCGEITPEDAIAHPASGQLTQYVGMPPPSLPEIRAVPIVSGDRLLLCTDGLYGTLDCRQILSMLREEEAAEKACRKLIDAANQAGGRDNITALIVEVNDRSTR